MKQQQALRADILILNQLTLHAGCVTHLASGSELSSAHSSREPPCEWNRLLISTLSLISKPSQEWGGQN